MSESPTFADVRRLFRENDREEMLWAFDLWSSEDVRQQRDLILERLESGDMPCDDRWPDEHIELFRRWIEAGAPD
jgi:hypothetical protein